MIWTLPCPDCEGHGWNGRLLCLHCNGTGKIVVPEKRAPDRVGLLWILGAVVLAVICGLLIAEKVIR